MKRIESRIDDLEKAVGEIKETLHKAFEREQGQWKSVFDAVDMNFKEIRDYAEAIYELVQPLVPITMKAFMDFRMNALQLSGPEIEAIANGTPIESVGERREFEQKLRLLGLDKKC